MNEQVFADALKHPRIGETARVEWERYRGDVSQAAAVLGMMAQHTAHLAAVYRDGVVSPTDDGVFITDIPDYDLTVVDAYFPSLNQRQVGIFSRKVALQVGQVMLGRLQMRLGQ